MPLAIRPLVQAANFITITLLPRRIRQEYGFSRLPPQPVRRALVAGGAEYVKRALLPLMPERMRFHARRPVRARLTSTSADVTVGPDAV